MLEVNGVQFDGQSYVSMWYQEAYPHDEWGNAMMNKGITFDEDEAHELYALLKSRIEG